MYSVSITGASGAILGVRLIEELLNSGKSVASIISDAGWEIIHHELFRSKEGPSTMEDILKDRNREYDCKRLKEYRNDDLLSPLASGTFPLEAVIVIPCSMKTLSGIATGYADTLINRVVDVALKERRRCVLVPRETPLNLIHLENLLKAKIAGADILLPIPGFYTFPQTVDDIVDFVVGKTLNLLDIDHKLFKNWGEGNS